MRVNRVEIDGLDELRRALRRIDGGVPELKKAHKEAGDLVAKDAATIVPVRSGKLRRSIRAVKLASGAEVRAGRARVPYAGPIHFGWPGRPSGRWQEGRAVGGPIAPNPFLYRAADRRKLAVIKIYERRIDELARKVEMTT